MLCVHVDVGGFDVVVGADVGTEVIGGVEVGLSQHPQMIPGVSQCDDVGAEPEHVGVVVMVTVVVMVGSRHPNQPGS